MADANRQEIRDKVEAGAARNRAKQEPSLLDSAGETAIEAKDKFTAFAKDHPFTTVAGGLALGILVSGLFKNSPTRKAAEQVGAKTAGLAALGAEMAMAYAAQAMSAADSAGRASAHTLGELGDRLGDTVRDGTDTASDVARTAGKRIARAIHGRFN